MSSTHKACSLSTRPCTSQHTLVHTHTSPARSTPRPYQQGKAWHRENKWHVLCQCTCQEAGAWQCEVWRVCAAAGGVWCAGCQWGAGRGTRGSRLRSPDTLATAPPAIVVLDLILSSGAYICPHGPHTRSGLPW